jgi:multicomponent Na+:H+ antiporter subunit C
MDINLDISLMIYIAAGGLILTGSAGIVLSTHLLRIIFGIALLEAGANLLLLLASYRDGTAAPIIVDGQIPVVMADPVPQALVLTSIVRYCRRCRHRQAGQQSCTAAGTSARHCRSRCK